MKNGFVPALGTPIGANGAFLPESYAKQIERMLDAGAVALLCMGSMGQQAFLRPDACVQAARTAVKCAAGRVPVFVGAMDNSIARAKDRIASMEQLDLTAFVFTTPYYEVDTDAQVLTYFKSVAKATKHGVILYDLPGVTKHKITYEMVLNSVKSRTDGYQVRRPRDAAQNPSKPAACESEDFLLGLDTFDIAYSWGIGNILDGMLPCTPYNTQKLIQALDTGDLAAAAQHLSNIVALRDFINARDLWPCVKAAMNLLCFEGLHSPDWCTAVSSATVEEVRGEMIRICEL